MGKLFKTQEEFQQEKKAAKAVRVEKMPSLGKIIMGTWDLLAQNGKLFWSISGLYLLAYWLFAQGIASTDLVNLKQSFGDASHSSQVISLTAAALGFGGDTGNNNSATTTYGTLTTIVFGLCFVWAARQVLAGRKIRIRDALYNGPTALISVVTLLIIILIQTLPMALGIFMYGAALSNGLLRNWLENGALLLVMVGGIFWTCYMYGYSLLSLVTVTLPGMYPRKALKATRELVGSRRWYVLLYIAIFALVVAVVWLVLVVGLVSNNNTLGIAEIVVGLLRAVTLMVSLLFLYKLYRALVDETTE